MYPYKLQNFFFLPQTFQNHFCKTMKTFERRNSPFFKSPHQWVILGIPPLLPLQPRVADALSTLILPAAFLAYNDYCLTCSCWVCQQVSHVIWCFSNISEDDGTFVDYSGSSDSDDPLDDSNKDKDYVYSGEDNAESEEVSDEELVFAGKSKTRVSSTIREAWRLLAMITHWVLTLRAWPGPISSRVIYQTLPEE